LRERANSNARTFTMAYMFAEINNNQTAHYQVMHLVAPPFTVGVPRRS